MRLVRSENGSASLAKANEGKPIDGVAINERGDCLLTEFQEATSGDPTAWKIRGHLLFRSVSGILSELAPPNSNQELVPTGLNDNGIATGLVWRRDSEPVETVDSFVWTPRQGLRLLRDVVPSPNVLSAYAINNRNEILAFDKATGDFYVVALPDTI